MFEESMFSVGISKFKVDGVDNESLCKDIKYYCTNPTNRSVIPRALELDNPLLTDLNEVVLGKTQNILDGIIPTKNNSIKTYIKRMWGNHNLNADICSPHAHRDSFLSVVYYPKSTDGTLRFYCPWMDQLLAHIPISCDSDDNDNFHQYNSSYHELNVVTGMLVIFPAMVCHIVPPCKNERYSVVYDIGVKQ
jgi:hypothetical protein